MKIANCLLLLLCLIPVSTAENFRGAGKHENTSGKFTGSASTAADFCDTGKPHPIDLWFEKEMDKTEGVTVNIRNAQGEAYSRWDKELNRVYGELLNKLNAEDKKRLHEAQRAWLKFRDAEFGLLWADALYGGIGGTLAPIAVSDAGREIVRERVCTLLQYQGMANNFGASKK